MQKYNIEHELSLLGAVKFDNGAYDLVGLAADDFYDKENGRIFSLIGAIIDEGLVVDDIIMADKIRKQELKISIGKVAQLQAISSANITYYADSIRELSQRRKLRALVPMIEDGVEGKEIKELVADINDQMSNIFNTEKRQLYHVKDLLIPVLAEIEEAYNSGNRLMDVPSGFNDLDAKTNGFAPGELIIIGARPSIGKTALALSMAMEIATRHGLNVGFFSCEMSKETLIKRMVAGLGHINLEAIKTGMMTEVNFVRLMAGFERVRTAKMVIDDTPNISLSVLKQQARRMRIMKCAIIFVDYLTLIQHDNVRMPRHERVGEISKALKVIARELEIPVVAMSQVGREAEGRMPTLANLRQSGEVEEDSDIVLLMHRERDGNETTVEIVKNRNGATGKIELTFLPQYAIFGAAEKLHGSRERK